MKAMAMGAAAAVVVALTACQTADSGDAPGADPGSLQHQNVLIDLWADGTAAFGIFVPNERPLTAEQRRSGERSAPVYTREGGERLARNPLYDFLFLNLEGGYDPARAGKDRPRPSEPQVRPVSARRLASTCRLFPARYGLRTSNAKGKSRNPGSDAGSP